MGFSRQEYWSRLPFPPPGDLPNPGIKPRSPTLPVDSLPAKPQGKPKNTGVVAYPLSRGSSQPRNGTEVTCIAGRFFTSWATREVHHSLSHIAYTYWDNRDILLPLYILGSKHSPYMMSVSPFLSHPCRTERCSILWVTAAWTVTLQRRRSSWPDAILSQRLSSGFLNILIWLF